MKIAVISDLHGNMQALESVLEDAKQQKCEKILCLGDLAMAGPQPRMTIDFIQEQKNWEIIQGNTDKLIGDFCPEYMEEVKSHFPIMANALAEEILYLSDEQKEYLRTLPENKILSIEGVRIMMVHGSPRRNNENIFPDMPISEIEEIFKEDLADLTFCGHTHIPCGYQTNKKQTIVNVGSVGRPMTKDAKACYVVANIENGGFSIEHRFLDYDRELAADILMQRTFEGREQIAQMLLHPDKRHV